MRTQIRSFPRCSFWGMSPRRPRWEKVAMRRRQAGPEGVGGGGGRGELGLCQSEGRPLEAGGFRRGPAEAQALWAGPKHRGCGPAAALSPVV